LGTATENITECRLRRAIGIVFIPLVILQTLFALPEFIRPTFSLGVASALFHLSIGLAAGIAVAAPATFLLHNRLRGSLVFRIHSWYLYGGIGLFYIIWGEIPSRMAGHCVSLSRAQHPECFAGIFALNWMLDGAVYGLLMGTLLWTIIVERQRKQPVILAIRSKAPMLFHGLPASYWLIIIGVGILIIYTFYQIFQLK